MQRLYVMFLFSPAGKGKQVQRSETCVYPNFAATGPPVWQTSSHCFQRTAPLLARTEYLQGIMAVAREAVFLMQIKSKSPHMAVSFC